MINSISDCRKWIETHPTAPLDLVRIYLGAGLVVKGLFPQDPAFMAELEKASLLASLPGSVSAYVTFAFVGGGIFLALGLLTRVAALVTLPIFYTATVAYIVREQTLVERQVFEFYGLLLFLSTILVIFGPGPWSLDKRLFGKAAADSPARTHPDLFLDVTRVFLGIALFVKGVFFMENREMLRNLIEQAGGAAIIPIIAAHYVVPAHLAGGILLALGLVTRVAAVAQLPLLLGAVLYVFMPRMMAIEGRQDFEFTTLVLFLVVLAAVFGGGRWSLDHVLEKSYLAQLQPKPTT